MKIVLLGQIASGKGTLSQALQEKYAFEPISIGKLLRDECNKDTAEAKLIQDCLVKGCLVSDDLALKVLKKHLETCGDKNIIFDGYPRNAAQAKSLDSIAKIDHVLFLNLDNKLVRQRFMGRRECEKCGYVSNVNYPEYTGVCPKCKGKLVTRNDFSEEAMLNKMKSFEKDTKPLIDYYKKRNLLAELDASKERSQIIKDAEKILKIK